jgi:hypothetical protein
MCQFSLGVTNCGNGTLVLRENNCAKGQMGNERRDGRGPRGISKVRGCEASWYFRPRDEGCAGLEHALLASEIAIRVQRFL